MKLAVTLLLLFALSFYISSCNKGPTGGIPFYVKMDTAVILAPANVSTSSNTQGIQDVWVEEGPNNIGAYELPCNFPVLDEGQVYFVVQAGVWQSAQSGKPVIYPFLNADTFTISANPTSKYSHVPKFSYKQAAKILCNEDFEQGMDYNSKMTRVSDSAKYGYRCGKITVGPNDSSVLACQQGASGGQVGGGGGTCPYALTSGQEIWVEIDYKSEVPFWSGVIAHFNSGATDTIQILFLLPTPNWTKQYIKLSEIVGNEGATSFNLYFQGLNPSGFAGGSVYLDNIRLIHM